MKKQMFSVLQIKKTMWDITLIIHFCKKFVFQIKNKQVKLTLFRF